MRAALLAPALLACSTTVDANGCPWSESEVQLEYAVAREMVRRDIGRDPGPVDAEALCFRALPPGVSGEQRGRRLWVKPTTCINRSALMHEAAHLLLDESTGDPDAAHSRALWAKEQFERGCGRVP